MMLEPLYDYQFRLILIGDSTVGKSSLLRYFTDGKFSEISDPTVGVDFYSRLVQVRDGTRIKLQLWDTAGQERFRSITKSYYRNSVGVLVAYDVCSRTSFNHLESWMNEARQYIHPLRPVFLLLGCKSDCYEPGDPARPVPEEEVADLAAALGLRYIETSAKTGTNVELAFSQVAQEIYNRIRNGEYRIDDNNWDGIKIGSSRGLAGGNDSLPEAETPSGLSACC